LAQNEAIFIPEGVEPPPFEIIKEKGEEYLMILKLNI